MSIVYSFTLAQVIGQIEKRAKRGWGGWMEFTTSVKPGSYIWHEDHNGAMTREFVPGAIYRKLSLTNQAGETCDYTWAESDIAGEVRFFFRRDERLEDWAMQRELRFLMSLGISVQILD